MGCAGAVVVVAAGVIPMELTQLQARVARDIVAITRRDHMKQGDHLNETVLAERIGTSRSPVNAALRHLVDLGIVIHDPNRGHFLERDAEDTLPVTEELFEKSDEPLYLKISQDRLSKHLGDEMTESDLMKRYGVSRNALRKILSRIQQEGWIERQVGQGWRFLPMIDSPEAYEESYFFRTALEPLALLSSTFCPNQAEFDELQQRQRFIANGGYESMTAIELFEANRELHETLMKWSGNRFFAQTIQRMNQLRRLVEYNQARHRKSRKQQALEHLAILEAIAQQDTLRAASLLREHLNNARKAKVYLGSAFKQNFNP
jgi:DNA-binding GntR family transcriptional regulator